MVCQILGINYLCTDALCVLQDSSKDWEKESAQIEHICSESILNIAAGFADNSSNRPFRIWGPISQWMPSEWKSIRIPRRVSPERIIGVICFRPPSGSKIHGNTLETRLGLARDIALTTNNLLLQRAAFLALPVSLYKGRKTGKLQHCCSSSKFKGLFSKLKLWILGVESTLMHMTIGWRSLMTMSIVILLSSRTNFRYFSGVAAKMQRSTITLTFLEYGGEIYIGAYYGLSTASRYDEWTRGEHRVGAGLL